MKQHQWPSAPQGEEKQIPRSTHATGSIAVDMRLRTKEVQRMFEDIIAKHPDFHVQDAKYDQSSRVDLIILEAAYDHHVTFSYIESVLQNGLGPDIFLIAESPDQAMKEHAYQIGVKEFLPRPLHVEEISAALDRCAARRGKCAHTRREKARGVISFLGGRGGIGTTTIAVNFAMSLCMAKTAPSVVLLELNEHAGDMRLFLDVSLPHTLRELGSRVFPLDSAAINQYLVKHHSGLHVLSIGYTDTQAQQFPTGWIEPIIRILKTQFDFVVIDCGHSLAATTTTALRLSTTVIVAATLTMTVVKRTELVLDYLNRAGIPTDEIRWVLNRYIPEEDKILKETEQIFHSKTSWIIPNDYPRVSQSMNSGQPFVITSPRSAISKSFRHMTSSFLSNPETAKNSKESGWVNRIWSKVSKEKQATALIRS